MSEPFHVDTDGVASLHQTHDQVAAAVRQLAGAAPAASDLEARFGTIASPLTSALGEALPNREATLRATSASSETIGELLQAAARRYEQGDDEGAAKLRAAAETLAGSDGTDHGVPGAVRGAGALGTGTGTGASPDPAAQMGQQVGQLAQSVAQSVQGLAQGLTQLPQQIVQGVQGVVGSLGKASGAADLEGAGSRAEDGEKDARDREDLERDRAEEGDREATKDLDEVRPTDQHAVPPRDDGAQSGRSAEDRAPLPPPVAERPHPAQTRPQQVRPS